MFGKCRYLDEITGGRGVVFATGTPVINSMTELYTVMRYLQYSTLQQKKLTHFDCWASTFGETTTAIELAPEGTGYRARTRFAKFFNLPELMNMFKEVADIKTSDQLHLPVPEAKLCIRDRSMSSQSFAHWIQHLMFLPVLGLWKIISWKRQNALQGITGRKTAGRSVTVSYTHLLEF